MASPHVHCNPSKAELLEAIGVYIGASNVEETSYAYTDDVTGADNKARTA